MPFGFDLGDIFDLATDFIPGGDWLDDLVGIDGNGNGNGQSNGLPGVGPYRDRGTADRRPVGDTIDPNTGCPRASVPLMSKPIATCPRGYVAVDTNNDGINDVCMLKDVARKCRLWSPRARPFLTGGEMRTIRKAARLMDKTDRLVRDVNKVRGKAKLVRARSSR